MIDKRIWNNLKLGLDMLYENDQYLISIEGGHHVSERSIAHKLGCYLSNLINEYNVDCEFNRNLDAVIHKRGSNKDNLVVIEVKPWWNHKKEDFINDENKLLYLTDSNYQYKYKYGLSLIIKLNRGDTEVKIFIDGKTDDIYYKI